MSALTEVDFSEQLRIDGEEHRKEYGAPTPCIHCGRMIVTTGYYPECLECHDFDLNNLGYQTDQDGEEIDYDAMPYAQYLRTDHWQAVRQTKIEAASGKCACCSSTLQLHVHHREYPTRRLDIKPSMLVVLCKRCHSLLHG